MVEPAATAVADATCVIERSAPATCTDAVAVLFPPAPGPVHATVTEFVIVDPPGASGLASTTTVKLTEEPAATLGSVQMMAPVPPTAGFVPQVLTEGGVTETKSVLGGVF